MLAEMFPIAEVDRLFLGMHDFDFSQIWSNMPKFCFNLLKFRFNLPKFLLNFTQIQPNLPKSNQFRPKNFARGCSCISCIPSSFGTDVSFLQ